MHRCDTLLLLPPPPRDIQKIWPWTHHPGTATIAVPICPPCRFPTTPPLPTVLIRILAPSPKTLVRRPPTPFPRRRKSVSNLTSFRRRPAVLSAKFAHSRRLLPLKWRIRPLRSIPVCRQPSADYQMRPVLIWQMGNKGILGWRMEIRIMSRHSCVKQLPVSTKEEGEEDEEWRRRISCCCRRRRCCMQPLSENTSRMEGMGKKKAKEEKTSN